METAVQSPKMKQKWAHTRTLPLIKNVLVLQVYSFSGGVIFVQKHGTLL